MFAEFLNLFLGHALDRVVLLPLVTPLVEISEVSPECHVDYGRHADKCHADRVTLDEPWSIGGSVQLAQLSAGGCEG